MDLKLSCFPLFECICIGSKFMNIQNKCNPVYCLFELSLLVNLRLHYSHIKTARTMLQLKCMLQHKHQFT